MPKLNLEVPIQLKSKIDALAKDFNLPQAVLVRLILKTGLPLLQQILEAEQSLLLEIRNYRNRP